MKLLKRKVWHISFKKCGNQQVSATIEHHAATSTAEAGPSRDWEQGAEEVNHTRSPTSSLEDESHKEAAVDTAQTLNKSDPLLQWEGERQQEEKQRVGQTPVSRRNPLSQWGGECQREEKQRVEQTPVSVKAETCIISRQGAVHPILYIST
jgi:hypothetical protein